MSKYMSLVEDKGLERHDEFVWYRLSSVRFIRLSGHVRVDILNDHGACAMCQFHSNFDDFSKIDN